MTERFNDNHPVAGRSGTWLTPGWILDPLGEFDLDPCAAPDPGLWPTARQHYFPPTDGLAMPWWGRVWLNPPYGREAWKWLRKLADHGHGTALIPARTDTEGFHEHVWRRATGILFLRGRVKFHYPDGIQASANSGAPSCLIAYGGIDYTRLLMCSGSWLPGQCVNLEAQR